MSLDYSIYALTATWITQLRTPDSIIGNDAFNHIYFCESFYSIGSQLESVPPQRHQRNVRESKHRIIRSVHIRLRVVSPQTGSRIHEAQATDASNPHYCSDIMSAHENSHWFYKPVNDDIKILPEDVISAQQTFGYEQKVAKIFQSKSPGHQPVPTGDLIKLFVKSGKGKGGKQTSPRLVL